MAGPDFKPEPVIRDSDLLAQLHEEWTTCAVCEGVRRVGVLSLHHIVKRPRDDVRGNLVMLCGDGTRGCHGDVEGWQFATRKLLGWHLLTRADVVQHLGWRLGGPQRAAEWLSRQLYVEVAAIDVRSDGCIIVVTD